MTFHQVPVVVQNAGVRTVIGRALVNVSGPDHDRQLDVVLSFNGSLAKELLGITVELVEYSDFRGDQAEVRIVNDFMRESDETDTQDRAISGR